jgi:hypothetical protein
MVLKSEAEPEASSKQSIDKIVHDGPPISAVVKGEDQESEIRGK